MRYYSKPANYGKNKIKLELELSNYTTKSELKNTVSVETSTFTKKTDLDSPDLDRNKLKINKSKNCSK